MSEITIPGFELERTLGAGGFGTVWLAHQPSVDRAVAVKIGHRALQDPVARSRFERECQALGRLSGRSDIVDVHVTGALPDGRPYLVMEYVDGGTLWDRIERGPLSAAEIATVGGQICAALDHAHRADILHRDIKPENVFLRADGSIVLGDFGIAAAHTTAVTRSAGLTATIPYTAPEVLEGERATVASDLYGVGATVLAAATRSVPFTSDTGADTSMAHLLSRVLEGAVPDIRAEGYPDGLARLVEGLMATDPANRPASATEAAAAFDAIGRPAAAWPAPVPDSQTVVVAPINAIASPAPPSPAAPIVAAAPVPDPGERRSSGPILLGVLTGLVLIAIGLGLRTLTGDGGEQAAADGIEVAASSSSDPASGSAEPADATSTTSTIATISTTTVAEPAEPTTSTIGGDALPAAIDELDLLAPIDIPLSPADVGLPDGTSAEFVIPDEDMGMCENPIDLSQATEVRNVLINDFAANDQVAQQAIQFEDEAAAEAFVTAMVASLDCRSWDEVTIDGTGQRFTIVPVEIVPRRRFGDDTRAWESTITFENGFTISQRSYLVRRHDRILGLSVASDDAGKVELAPTLMALMIDRLGYDV